MNPWPEWIHQFLWCTVIQTDLGSLILIQITPKERTWKANRCYLLRTTYLIFEASQILFPTASLIFTAAKLFHQVIWERTQNKLKLRIYNGGWHETLNLVHISSCETLHFVMSYMNRNRKRKQTRESVQYGLEIIFNANCTKPCICFYYIDTSVLLENTPLVKFVRNHIRDSSGVFSKSSLVKI